MADKRISELNTITGANTADDDLLVIVDTSASETKGITLGELEKALGERDFSFADDDKLVFGDGDDLQIYHDGTDSYIVDSGTGDLNIRAYDHLRLQNNDGSRSYFVAFDTGASRIYYNGNEKLATTNTGIDVTGTVTADGLTVDNGGSQPVTTLVTTGTGGGTQPTFKFQRNTDSLNDNAQVGIIQWQAGTASNNVAGIYVDHVGTSENAARMEFYTSEGGNFRERMLIDNNGDISFYEDTGTTEKFFWDASAESLGIGTSSPARIIHTNSSVPALRLEDSDVSGLYYELLGLATGQFDLRIDEGNVQANSAFNIKIDGSDAMRIDSSGRVGIGTTGTPPGKVWIIHGSDSDYIFRVDGANATSEYIALGVQTGEAVITAGGVGSTSTDLVFKTAPSGSETEAMRIDSSGNLLVGTTATSPGYGANTAGSAHRADGQIHVSSPNLSTFNKMTSTGTLISFRYADAGVGSISVTASATAYNTSSDERLKENIQDADSAGSIIDDIQVRQFDWIKDGEHQRYGMIAQELNTVAPEAVTQGETENDMWAVDYSKLVPMLVKEIQDLRKRVADLEGN